ncbi:MAG: M15 family metallopeptidase [Mycobacteriales bacterium]|nr:M15 family metallopeptidase [Frankia sp.]
MRVRDHRSRSAAHRRVALCVVAVVVATTACAGASGRTTGGSLTPSGSAVAAPGPAVAVPKLHRRLRPDVFLSAPRSLSPDEVRKLIAVSPWGSATIRLGAVRIAGHSLRAAGVEPGTFRRFAASGTAESDPVWQAVARGEVVISHRVAQDLKLPLGGNLAVAAHTERTLRLGALATMGLPEVTVVMSDVTAEALGFRRRTGMVFSAGNGDPTRLAGQVRQRIRPGTTIDLLSQPAAAPLAFLTGSRAARAFGAFSYRYYPDGTIEPNRSWVRSNIVSAYVPILGRVTCHRLMIPQLAGALGELQRAGLSYLINTREYGGCYVPRFIEHNPSRSISLHTWGIAVDLNVATNRQGRPGDMDRRVVAAFAHWGLRWGGYWSPPDPMHFEIAALLT